MSMYHNATVLTAQVWSSNQSLMLHGINRQLVGLYSASLEALEAHAWLQGINNCFCSYESPSLCTKYGISR